MIALKIILMAIAIFSLMSIVIALVNIGLVLKNKGKVSISGWYFTVYSIAFAICVAVLIVMW